MKTGVANLPLHYGSAPPWLFRRMVTLARYIVIGIVSEFGSIELLKRLSDPFWFQSFGCLLGFDWHSSGLTTTVCAALKEGIKDIQKDLGLFIVGGKGKYARQAPFEIINIANRRLINCNLQKLIYSSRLSAKIDNSAILDGFNIYHHTFIFTKEGDWAVIQQGMNKKTSWARRYHWFSKELKEFVCEPHTAICGLNKVRTLNLVASESNQSRLAITHLLQQKPSFLLTKIEKIKTLNLPSRHYFSLNELNNPRLKKIILTTYKQNPSNFEQVLAIKNLGPQSLRALTFIAQIIYGTEPSFKDPLSFSFAHGGKDGIPYPVNRKNYDQSIEIMKKSIIKSNLGWQVKNNALKKLAIFYG